MSRNLRHNEKTDNASLKAIALAINEDVVKPIPGEALPERTVLDRLMAMGYLTETARGTFITADGIKHNRDVTRSLVRTTRIKNPGMYLRVLAVGIPTLLVAIIALFLNHYSPSPKKVLTEVVEDLGGAFDHEKTFTHAPPANLQHSPERYIANKVFELGGSVCINKKWVPITSTSDLPGEDFTITEVILDGATGLSGYDVKQMVNLGFKHLESIRLEGTGFTDEGLAILRNLDELNQIRLNRTNVTDRGLDTLMKLPKLRNIDLRDCSGITDTGALLLGNSNREFDFLDLRGTGITKTSVPALLALHRNNPSIQLKLDAHLQRQLTQAASQDVH